MRFLSFLLFFLSTSFSLFSQIQLEPLTVNPVLQSHTLKAAEALQKTSGNSSKIQSANPAQAQALSLPFFDDFSYAGPYPNTDLWADSNVYINNHLAFQPPSIGVATFDGLNRLGVPYGGGYGPSDYLTSNVIDLSDYTASDDIYLSFYLQPKGISNFFPSTNDTLVLQFRDTANQWVTMDVFKGLPSSTSPLDTFYFSDNRYSISIDSTYFLQDSFQFRFVNYCNRLGMQFLWHLDYVYLDNRLPDVFTEDLAFINTPNSVLKTYRHMPAKHYDPAELRTNIDVGFFNNYTATIGANDNNLSVINQSSGSKIVDVLLVGSGNERNVDARSYKFFNGLSADLSNINGLMSTNPQDLVLDMVYTFDPSLNEPSGIPLLKSNNEVHNTTEFSNFFAYDDGSAEGIITARNMGTQIAEQFHANVADTLRGVQFNFPYTGASLNAKFILKVWLNSLDGEPIYTSKSLSFVQADQFYDTLNAFSTYPLLNEDLEKIGLPIPAGVFYVGIEHISVTNTNIGIGYDLNSPEAQPFQWFKNSGFNQQWLQINQAGALMIRPLVGSEVPVATATVDLGKPKAGDFGIKIAPNPARDQLYLQAVQVGADEALEMLVFDATGKLLLHQSWESPIDLSPWTDGLYFLQVNNLKTGQQVKEKFLILR